MEAGEMLRAARRRAGLSQRTLAERTGIAQPTIARIESGVSDPRLETLRQLLRACGEELRSVSRPGYGIDRTQIREMLRRSPRERVELLAADVSGWDRLEAARR